MSDSGDGAPGDRELTAEQIRVLGALIEKERTTPDLYPLTTNALVASCNQRNNRDPVVSYDEQLVDATMLSLREAGLARTVRPSGNRARKHRHVLGEMWGLDDSQLAVLAVLMLRGPQTVAELRTRTERYGSDDGSIDVESVLGSLASLEDPLAVDVGRIVGQSQDRWTHLAGEASSAGPGDYRQPSPSPPPMQEWRPAGAAPHSTTAPPPDDELERLAARVERLEERLGRLEGELGLR